MDPTTAGAWLRQARQQRGLHIAALAVTLKVPQAKLEALEADRFDLLPDATFARALATAMCRALKVDSAPVLALLPRTHEREFDVRPGLNQPFRERAGGPIESGWLAQIVRPVVWGPALLLAAAAFVYWLPAGWLPERGEPATAPASGPADASASAPGVDFIAAPAASAVLAMTQPPVAAASAASSAATPRGEVASAPAAALPGSNVVASAPLQVRPVAAPDGVASVPAGAAASAVRITVHSDSWIELVDAQGRVLLSRLVRAGEQPSFDGTGPFRLKVGNVRGTQVEWRGQAVDLTSRASNNVARLELN
ncbi:RodZ domain-containing protein [Roseateles sp. BYS87W]|uniref:RodZ domain-containing protein n=1 Tax=Pelomonas baiyunensis TaxID=3299026 RepID=A0ABW7GVE3_9BURK